MAKKAPTFGQHPYDPAQEIPQSQWEPIQDLSNLQNFDGVLVAGDSSRQAVAIQSQFMFPDQTRKYADWALHNPTMDPRAWQPLAVAGISPNSAPGADVSTGAIAAGVANGTHDTAVGSNQTVKPSGAWSSQTNPFGTTTAVPGVTPQGGGVTPDHPDTPLLSLMNGGNEALGAGIGLLGDAVRGVQYTLQSGWDAMQGTNRTWQGLSQKQQELAKAAGLSEDEARIAFPVSVAVTGLAGKQTVNDNAGASVQAPTVGQSVIDQAAKIGPGGMMAGLQLGGQQEQAATYDSLPVEKKRLIDEVRKQYDALPEAQPMAQAKAISDQTALGQIAKDPSLLTNDSGILATNPKVWSATEQASLAAYDMRTVDEIARGVKPIGWTPGRGIAHVVAEPDTQAFNTISGTIDFQTNLMFDPAKAIPINAGARVIHGASDLVDMMAGGGTNFMGGAIRRAQKTGGAQIAVETTGAPVSVITDAEKAAVQSYTGTGHKIVNNGLRSSLSTPKAPTAGMSKVAAARTEALDTVATKHSLPEDTVLYRKVTHDVPTAKGRVIRNEGFSSTTTAEQAAGRTGTVLRIHAPKGAAGIDVNRTLDAAATDTGEFILPRGSKLKVTGTDGDFVDVVLTNPRKAVGVGPATGGLAAARAASRGDEAVSQVDASGNLSGTVSDLPGGAVIDPTGTTVTHPSGSVIVMAQNAWDFFNSGRGKALVNDLVEEKSASRIMARSNWKIDHDLANTLADARTPEEVRAAIGTRMGFDLSDPKSLRNFGSSRPAIFKDVALRDSGVLNYLRKAPHAKPFDLEDVDNTITQVSRFARGARMSWDQIQPHLDNIIRAGGANEKTYAAIYGGERLLADGTTERVPGLLDAVADHISIDLGIDKKIAKKVTTAFKGGLDETLRNYVNTGLADTMGSSMDGMVGAALLDSELLTRAAVLPDYRTVRELTGAIGRILAQHPNAETANVEIAKVINSATSAWKSAVLVRPAYIMREVGEMAVASSLGGYEGILTHPSAFLGLVIGTIAQKEAATSAGRMAQALTKGAIPEAHFATLGEKALSGGVGTKMTVGARKGTYYAAATPAAVADYLHLTQGMSLLFPALDPKWARVNGDGLFSNMNDYIKTGDSATLESIYRGFSAVSGNFNVDERGMGRAASRYLKVASQQGDPDEYAHGLIDKIAAMAADGDMRNLANPGIDFRHAVSSFVFSGRRDRKVTAGAKNFAGKSNEEYMNDLNDVLQKLTGGDEKLLHAVATGNFEGGILRKSNKSLVNHIKGMIDDPAQAKNLPPTMRVSLAKYDKNMMTRVNDGVSQFFEYTGETSDLLQRGPLFRQAYVREAERLAPSMSPEAHAKVVADLRKAGDNELANRMEGARPGGTLQSYEVDHMAAKFARDEQKRLFYDAHERQNYAVALRTLMPFAQATFNTIRRWGQFSLENPQAMYRTLKPLNYAMQPAAASMYGALGALYGQEASSALFDPSSYGWDTPDNRHNSADGFFYNDNYGDRKFSYPMVGILGQWAGIPKAAMNESSLSGLNVAGTSIQPGFGPAVTFAASLFGQDLINRDDPTGSVMRFLFPYGLPKGNLLEKAGISVSPSWMVKVIKGSDDSGSVANLAVKLQGVLLDSGKYNIQSSIDQKRLAEDSAELAKRLFVWNAVMGALTPSTINTKALTKDDPSGKPVGAGYTPSDGGAMVDAILSGDPKDKNRDAQRWIIQDKMKQEWDKYTAGTGSLDSYRNGVLNFVHDHGASALFSVLPGTTGADGVSPTQATNDVWHFYTHEPETYRQNRDVIGLFFAGGSAMVPGDTSATGYASPLYTAQKDMGERTQQTADEHVRAAMSEYGWTLYNPKKAEIEKNDSLSADEKAAANSRLSADIRHVTNGAWTGKPLDSGKSVRLMEQLGTAVQDPTIQTLNSAPYLKDYMDYRDEILQQMRHDGVTLDLSTKSNQGYAIKLIDRAKELLRADPTGAFNNAWNRLLINEFGSA
jgi:hypothetical protein